MAILERFSDIIRANINDMLDKMEDPAIMIDQGTADQFLETQLKPHLFEDACADAGQALTLRLHEGYDHSYYFIQSFIGDHIRHHADILRRACKAL